MNMCAVSLAISVAVMSVICEPISPIEPTITIEDNSIISIISVEEYVARVIAHEVPHTFEKEALKSQAVAARTYLYYCLENNSRTHDSADVCTSAVHCCGYTTEAELAERFGKTYASKAFTAARGAAAATAGEILTYEDKPILAVWHASSAEYTENSGDVWQSQLPYLRSVSSPETAETNTVIFTLGDATERLMAAGYKYNKKTTTHISRTAAGRCDTLTLGNITLDADDARSIFGLKSTDFTAWALGGRLYFIVRGYGHGVGMSQEGANIMAKNGQTYKEILTHYYQGSELSSFYLD